MREFNKIRDYSILELTNYIVKEFHIPLRKDLKDLEFHVKNIPDNKNFKEDISLAKEVFKQFKTEITKHIDDEENCFFKEAVALEKNEIKDLYQVKKFLVVQETEHNEIDNYLV
jgi:iron-sulfur cluster repair protein YtfE (RIC family)